MNRSDQAGEGKYFSAGVFESMNRSDQAGEGKYFSAGAFESMNRIDRKKGENTFLPGDCRIESVDEIKKDKRKEGNLS